MFEWVKKLVTGRGFSTVEERLRYYLSVSDTILAFSFFSLIFGIKLRLRQYFGTTEAIDIARQATKADFFSTLWIYTQDMGAIALLALFTFVWYFLYKRAVRNEIEIVTRLYSKFNPPHDWESMIGRSWAPILAVLMTLTFIALAWFIDRIQIYCVILMLMGIQDVRGNSFVRRNLAKHFIDQRYVPLDSDLHKPFIMRRREIAEEYWINRPHIERIGLMIVGFMLAFLAAISEQVIGIKVWKEVPYLIVIFTIIANEVTMVRWRRLRDKALETVDLEQEHADRRRTGELTPEMTATPPPAPSA